MSPRFHTYYACNSIRLRSIIVTRSHGSYHMIIHIGTEHGVLHRYYCIDAVVKPECHVRGASACFMYLILSYNTDVYAAKLQTVYTEFITWATLRRLQGDTEPSSKSYHTIT